MTVETLGIDIGGVIIDRANEYSDTSFFGEKYLDSYAVRQSFGVIAQLVADRFGGRVYLVSKCGAATEKKTKKWLQHNQFFAKTGVRPEHVRFCRKRIDKAAICVELGVTHFVDDRLEVLSYLTTVPHRFLFQPNMEEVWKHGEHLPYVTQVISWHEIKKILLS